MSPSSRRARVVLPLPLSPTTAVTRGGTLSTLNEKSSRATVTRLSNNPPPKTFEAWRISRSAVTLQTPVFAHAPGHRHRTNGKQPSDQDALPEAADRLSNSVASRADNADGTSSQREDRAVTAVSRGCPGLCSLLPARAG